MFLLKPLKLSGLMDFARKDIKIANREKGSTPRIYLDQFLFSEKILQPSKISGYHTELVSDISTAAAIATHKADSVLEKNTQHTSPDFWILFRFRHFLCIWSWKRKPFPSLDSLLFLKLYGLKISERFFRDRPDIM